MQSLLIGNIANLIYFVLEMAPGIPVLEHDLGTFTKEPPSTNKVHLLTM